MKKINYFLGCKTEEEAKKRFRVLSKKLHPDKATGSKDSFQELLEQYTDFQDNYDTKPKSTFERFTEFLEIFKGMYKLEKVNDQWILSFSDKLHPDFFKKISLGRFFHDNRFVEFKLDHGPPSIILSKPYSSIITASLSIYEFIQVSN